jgi:hypothetical protein
MTLTRLNSQERTSVVKSGSIFVYEEAMSGIKRWTDGLTWSPSRILGNFLIYRELDGCLASKENKRKPQVRDRVYKAGQNKDRLKGTHCRPSHLTLPATRDTDELRRSIVGSLINSYTFKTGGLVKKAISVTVSEVAFHLVSYYAIEDIVHERLSTPCDMYQSVAFYSDSDV